MHLWQHVEHKSSSFYHFFITHHRFCPGKKNPSDWISISQCTLVGIALDFLYSIHLETSKFRAFLLIWAETSTDRSGTQRRWRQKFICSENPSELSRILAFVMYCSQTFLVLELGETIHLKKQKDWPPALDTLFSWLSSCVCVYWYLVTYCKRQPCCNLQSSAHTVTLMLIMGRLMGVTHRPKDQERDPVSTEINVTSHLGALSFKKKKSLLH